MNTQQPQLLDVPRGISPRGRAVDDRDDGVSGLHPGHTPYMNLDDWDTSMTMGSPSKLSSGVLFESVLMPWRLRLRALLGR